MSKPIYQPSSLIPFLEKITAKPKKSLSQNFIIDGNILRKMIKEVKSEDVILEIGPGPGALTELLLENGATVIAVEKDPLFAKTLSRLQKEDRLTILCTDFLDLDFSLLPEKEIKVIANLPYHLTTPILVKLLSAKTHFSSFTLMVQKEMAERLTALPGTKEYSSFTLFLNYHADVTYLFTVQPTCFFPIPSVQSAVIKVTLKPDRDIPSPDNFFLFVRSAFQKRRKMLRVSCKHLYPMENIENGLKTLGINTQARPEELTLDSFIQLYLFLQHKRGDDNYYSKNK